MSCDIITKGRKLPCKDNRIGIKLVDFAVYDSTGFTVSDQEISSLPAWLEDVYRYEVKATGNSLVETSTTDMEKRTVDVIKDHAVTLLLKKEETIIGYAHIDYEKNDSKYWFGICILPEHHNKGYGNYLMNNILIKSKIKNIEPIYLTVDNINIHAIKLYSKHNFKVLETNDKYTTMLLDW